MKEAFEKLKERLEEELDNVQCLCDEDDFFLGKVNAYTNALSIVSEVESEYTVHTNADYIRSLSDGELAHFLMDFKNNFDGSVYDWLREEK